MALVIEREPEETHWSLTFLTENGGGFEIIVLCGVFLGLLTNSEKLKQKCS